MKRKVLVLVLLTLILISSLMVTSCGDNNEELVTVTFMVDGTIHMTKTTVAGSGVLPPEVPLKEGYNGTWDISSFDIITKNLLVNAVYSPKSLVVTFKAENNDRINVIVATYYDIKYGSSLSVEDIPAVPDREGHTGRWAISDFSFISGNMNVNAIYDKNSYTITFVSNGGKGPEKHTGKYGDSLPADFIYDGYELDGWYLNEKFEGEKITTIPASDVTLYASWKEKKFTVTVDLGSPSLNNEIKKAYEGNVSESDLNALLSASREGYIFNGWYSDAEYTKQLLFPLVVKEDITVYGEWVEDNSNSASDVNLFNFDYDTQSISAKPDVDLPENLVIPSVINGRAVTSIKSFGFVGAEVDNVTIPASIKYIEEYAFTASTMKNVFFATNSTLISISRSAFEETWIGKLSLPQSVKHIDEKAFYNAELLHSITFGNANNLNFIGYQAFENTFWLTQRKQSLGENWKFLTIGQVLYASNAANLTGTASIPSSVVYISPRALENCVNLTEITMTASVKSISDNVFKNCSELTKVIFPVNSALEYMGEGVYEDCPKLIQAGVHSSNSANTYFNTDGGEDYYQISYTYIPKSLTALIVIGSGEIVSGALNGFASLENVTLMGNFTSIGEFAFANCENLSSISIGKNVTYIGKSAFANNAELVAVTFASGSMVEEIGEYAFEGATKAYFDFNGGLKNLRILGENAFFQCETLAAFVAPNIQSIGQNAFYGCLALKTASVPLSVTAATDIFDELQLESIIFTPTETHTAVAENMLASQGNLFQNVSAITLSEGITSIGSFAFNDTSIVNITIPASVESIEASAFSANRLLEKVVTAAESKLLSVGALAFAGCSVLETIVLPASLTSFALDAVQGNNNLQEIIVEEGSETYFSDEGVLYSDNSLLIYPSGKPNLNYTVADGSKKIASGAFASEDIALQNLFLPLTLTASDSDIVTFGSKLKLKSLSVSGEVPYLPAFSTNFEVDNLIVYGEKIVSGFLNFSEIVELNINGSISEIISDAFGALSLLEKITINAQVSAIHSSSFANMPKLAEITINNPSVLTHVGRDAFLGAEFVAAAEDFVIISDAVLYSYKGASEMVDIPNSVHLIADAAFENYRPENITDIAINLPENLKYIGAYTFYQANLKEISFNGNLLEIGSYAFASTGIETLHFPESLVSIGDFAFYNLSALTETVLPSTLIEIGDSSFNGSALKEIFIPESIEHIGDRAFAGSLLLAEIDFETISQNTYLGVDVFINTAWYNSSANGLLHLHSNGKTYIAGYKGTPSETIRSEASHGILSNAFYGLQGSGTFIAGVDLAFIGDYAFAQSAITNFAIANDEMSLTYIGGKAFYGCESLRVFNIASSLTDIDFNIFEGAINLEEVRVNENSPSFSADKIVYNKDETEILFVPYAVSGDIIVKNGVKLVPDASFKGRSRFTGITFPDTLQNIGKEAFFGATSLVSTKFSIFSSLDSIGEYAFYDTAISELNIESSVTHIGTFALYGISEIVFSGNAPSVDEDFAEIADDFIIMVPWDKLAQYQEAMAGYNVVQSVIVVTFYNKNAVIGSYEVLYKEILTKKPQLPVAPEGFIVSWDSNISKIDNELPLTENLDIRVVYTPIEYTLSFTGTQTEIAQRELIMGALIGDITIPAEEGKTFIMWSTKPNELEKFTLTEMPARDVNLYAIWFEMFFHLSDDGTSYSITGAGNSYGLETLVIPDRYNNVNVTSIEEQAFFETTFKHLVLGANITEIGEGSFANSQLLTVSVKPSLKIIGANAFSGSRGLISVSGLSSAQITTLGEEAFADCSSLLSVTLNIDFDNIGAKAFYGTSSLDRVEIFAIDLVKNIENFANESIFEASGVKSIRLPAHVSVLPKYTFKNALNLFEMDMTRFTVVSEGAFMNSGLRVAILPTVENIEQMAFYSAEHLNRVYLNPEISRVNSLAFAECASLESFRLPASLAAYGLGDDMFYNTPIKYIVFEGDNEFYNAESIGIGQSAYIYSTGITSEAYEGITSNVAYYDFISGDYVVVDNSLMFYFGAESVLTISDNINGRQIYNINKDLLISSYGITKITLPKVLQSTIQSGEIFSKAPTLNSIVLADSSGTIDFNGVLYNNDKTTLLAYPSGKTDTIFSVPATTVKIAAHAFMNAGKLHSLILDTSVVVEVESGAFSGYSDNLKIYVPKNLLEQYLGSPYWAEYLGLIYTDYESYGDFLIAELSDGNIAITQYLGSNTSVTLPVSVNGKNVTTIASYAFKGAQINDITIHGSIRFIKPYAFAHSTLVNVVISGALEELGEYAFAYNKSLSNISFTKAIQLRTLKEYTFLGCSSLQSFDLPSSVKTIQQFAFLDANLTQLTVAQGSELETIEAKAFYASQMQSIDLANALVLKTIGERAFFRSQLESLKLPESLLTIEDEAFSQSFALSSLVIAGASKLFSIGNSAFSDCALELLNIPSQTSQIGDYAFANNNIKSINFGSGSQLNSIGQYAFADAKEIRELAFADKLTSIGNGAFSGSENLLRVTFSSVAPPSFSADAPFNTSVRIYVPETALNTYKANSSLNWKDFTNGVNSVSNVNGEYSYVNFGSGVEIFQYIGGSSEIIIPEEIGGKAVLSIGSYAFNSSVQTIQLPSSLTTLKSLAFYKTAITEFTLTKNISVMDGNPFANCDYLQAINVNGNGHFALADGVLFNTEFTKLIAFPNKILAGETYNIPDTVNEIGESAFRGLGADEGAPICTLRIPFTVSIIGANAFHSTRTELIFDDVGTLRRVGEFAFDNSLWLGRLNDGLVYIVSGENENTKKALYGIKGDLSGGIEIDESTEVILPDSLASRKEITAVTLPSSLRYVAEGFLFGSYSIQNITTVGDYPLGHLFGTAAYGNSYEAYNPLNGKTYHIPNALSSVTVVSAYSTRTVDYMLANSFKVSSLTIGEDISYIGRHFTYGENMGISNLSITEGTEGIGSYAFESLPKLTSLYLPASVVFINSFAFANNSFLTNVIFNNESKLEHIGASAFVNNVVLKSIAIPCYVQYIGVRAFKNCRALTTLTFDVYPERINEETVIDSSELFEIADEAFMNCIYLQGVTTPNKLQILGDRVFYGCSSFLNFYYRANDTTTPFTYIGSEVFNSTLFFANEMQTREGFIIYGSVLYSYNDGGSPINIMTIPESIVSISPNALKNTAYNNTQINYITDSQPLKVQKLDEQGAPVLDPYGEFVYEYKLRTGILPIYDEDGEISGYEDEILTLSDTELSRTAILIMGRNVQRIGSYAFSELILLNKVLLPDSVKIIDEYAFFGCQSLTQVTNIEGVSKVGIDAFYGVPWYTNYKNSSQNDIIYIGKAAYEYIGNAYGANTQLEIAEGTESITPYLFKGQNGVIVVKFPSSVKDIGQFALNATRDGATDSLLHTVFVESSSIENVAGALTIASKVILNSAPIKLHGKSIYKYMTTTEDGTEIELTDTIYLTDLLAQYKAANKLPLIYVPDEYYQSYLIADGWSEMSDYIRPFATVYNNFVLEKDSNGDYNVIYYTGNDTHITIPNTAMDGDITGAIKGVKAYAFSPFAEEITLGENIEILYDYSFAKAISLQKVNMNGSSLKVISDYVFYMCEKLDNIILPDTTKAIGRHAFAYCTSLKTIDLAQVETIGDYSFRYCSSLAEIDIPETVTALGTHMFSDCEALKVLNIYALNPPALSSNGLYATSTVQIYVPENAYELYRTAQNWRRYEQRLHKLP